MAVLVASGQGMATARAAGKEAAPKSVYSINAVADGAILGSVTLLAAYPILNDYHFIHIQHNLNPDNLNSLDRDTINNRNVFLDNVSDVTVALSVAAPPILDYFDVGWNRVFYEDLMVYAQTMMVNSALSAFFKYTTQRPIPRVFAGDPKVVNSARGYEGFYSGHVATTMAALSAAAITLDLRHHAGIWPWIVVVVVGGAVAYERVAAGEHFPTQVFAGALMGPAVGTLVPWLHRREMEGKPTVSLKRVPSGAELTFKVFRPFW